MNSTIIKSSPDNGSGYDDFKEEKTVPFMFSETAAACIRQAAEEEGMTPENWLLSVVSLKLLLNSGYNNLKDYLEDDIKKNSYYDNLKRWTDSVSHKDEQPVRH